MPRYFLHVQDGEKVAEDLEGAEFRNVEAAREEAASAAIELIIDSLRRRQGLRLERTIAIADETGRIVAEVRFDDAVQSGAERNGF